jgi:hypothetical protein
MRTIFLLLALITAGCASHHAVVDGRTLARENLGYTDHDYFALMHYDAYPAQRGPSSGLRAYGGRLAGRVCGADLNLEAEYKGRHLAVLGYAQLMKITTFNARLQTVDIHVFDKTDGAGAVARHFTGRVSDDDLGLALARGLPPRHQIDFAMSSEWLRGRVGRREFDLHADGDQLVGTFAIGGTKIPFRLDGWGALWAMTPADQAAILPFMMTCIREDKQELVQAINLNFAH